MSIVSSDRFKIQTKDFTFWCASTIIFLGAIVRFREYLHAEAFRLDETWLALNFTTKNFIQITTEPLNFNQAAPPLFLASTKALIKLFGFTEDVVRFLPLIFGIASLCIFYLLLRKYCGTISTLLALSLLSFSSKAIRYSVEFKQYSGDIFFTLVLIFLGARYLSKEKPTLGEAILFGSLGAFAFGFSFAAIFVMASLGVILLSRCRLKLPLHVGIPLTIWTASLGLVYFASLRHNASNSTLNRFWNEFFMPLPPFSSGNYEWLGMVSRRFFEYAEVLGFGFGFVLATVGIAFTLKKNRTFTLLLLLPIVFTLTASGLELYPFRDRLLLFYMPMLFLFVAEGIAFLIHNGLMIYRLLGILALMIISHKPIINAYHHIDSPSSYSIGLRPVLHYIERNSDAGAMVCANQYSRWRMEYYAREYGIDPFRCRELLGEIHDLPMNKEKTRELKKHTSVWLVFLMGDPQSKLRFRKEERERLAVLNHFDTFGTRTNEVSDNSVHAYHYDLSSARQTRPRTKLSSQAE